MKRVRTVFGWAAHSAGFCSSPSVQGFSPRPARMKAFMNLTTFSSLLLWIVIAMIAVLMTAVGTSVGKTRERARMERARSREPLRGCGGPARITLSVIAIVWLLAVTLLVFGPAGCVSGMGIGMGVFLTLILAGPAVIYLLVSVIMTFTRKR